MPRRGDEVIGPGMKFNRRMGLTTWIDQWGSLRRKWSAGGVWTIPRPLNIWRKK